MFLDETSKALQEKATDLDDLKRNEISGFKGDVTLLFGEFRLHFIMIMK